MINVVLTLDVFMYRTIIAQLLSSDLSQSKEKVILLKRKETLNILSEYINEYKQSKYNLYDSLKKTLWSSNKLMKFH